jgi:alpha-glucosidase (family GH31 glycosyl hydrolase)
MRWPIIVLLLAFTVVVGTAACALLQPPRPTATEAPTSSLPTASPTARATHGAVGSPLLDFRRAEIRVEFAELDDAPVLSNLWLWDGNGRQFNVTEILTSTVLEEKNDGVHEASWALAAGKNAGIKLSVAAEQASPGVLSVEVAPAKGVDATALGVCLPAGPDEQFYGLGARFDHFVLTGRVLKNRTEGEAGLRNTYAPAPFLLSSQGYGLYVDTMAPATFDLRTEERGCYMVRVGTPSLHLYFLAGPHPQAVIERHAQLVGLPPLPPEWSFGVWKNLIGGQERVLRDLERLRQEEIPLDAVWIYDAVVERAGFGWPWQIYGPIPPGEYPDLPALIKELHGSGLKVLGYLNPFIYPGWAGYDQAQGNGYLVRTADGQVYLQKWTFGQRAYLDFTYPQAVQWWQDRVRYALEEVGFDGAMLDFGEEAPSNGRYAGGMGYLMNNRYPVLYHKAAYEVGEAAKPEQCVFLARAGYNGSQPYTTNRFTGDQVRNWHHEMGLASVLPAVLNGSLSGWPYWGPDIAGFFRDERAVRGPGEKELWIRWLQLGALMPTMRDMYGATDGEPVHLWTDDETLALFRTYAELHTALKPYLYRCARIAHEQGLPVVRPLFLNYPDEAETYVLEDQYLLGEDLLVAPVLEPGQTERSVYLPAANWRDYWTGETYQGPGRVTVPAPLHHIPLFVREGADLDLPSPGN